MEQHRWLVSVLHDLKIYAEKNELPLLTQEIIKAKVVAMSEIDGGTSYSAVSPADNSPRFN